MKADFGGIRERETRRKKSRENERQNRKQSRRCLDFFLSKAIEMR